MRQSVSFLVPLSAVCATVLCAAAVGAERSLLMEYLPQSLTAGAGSVRDLAGLDVDLDGDTDLVAADAAGVRVFLNDGVGGFVLRTIPVGGAANAIALGDFDADGDPDLAVARDATVLVLRNDGVAWTPTASFAMPAGDLGAVAARAADVDADGDVDLLVGLHSHTTATAWSGGLWVALGDGAGTFTALPTHDLAVPVADFIVADFDGDTVVDVAELGGFGVSSSTLALAFGNGDGTFSNGAVAYSAGLYAGALAAADFDVDGDVDLVTGWKYFVSVRRNDGSGAFGAQENFAVGAYVKGIAANDVDLDGDVDLMATTGGSPGMHLALNQGDGTFKPTTTVPSSSQCSSVALVDTNADGYADPWAADVVTGEIHGAASHCQSAAYGQAKPNSLGCSTTWSAQGSGSATGQGLILNAQQALPNQPALVLLGTAPTAQPTNIGMLWVAPPWFLLPTTTGASGVAPCAGQLTLAFTAAQLATGVAGTKVYMQWIYADPGQTDGSGAALSEGVWFELEP